MAEPTIDLGIILSVGELALKIPALFGMVETIDKKIDRLSKAEFESGYRFIDQAIDSTKEQDFLLRQAWTHLNKAISLESELRLALSYLGMSFCQFHLGERRLARESLEKILAVEIKRDIAHLTKKSALATITVGSTYMTFGIPALLATGVGVAHTSGLKRQRAAHHCLEAFADQRVGRSA